MVSVAFKYCHWSCHAIYNLFVSVLSLSARSEWKGRNKVGFRPLCLSTIKTKWESFKWRLGQIFLKEFGQKNPDWALLFRIQLFVKIEMFSGRQPSKTMMKINFHLNFSWISASLCLSSPSSSQCTSSESESEEFENFCLQRHKQLGRWLPCTL